MPGIQRWARGTRRCPEATSAHAGACNGETAEAGPLGPPMFSLGSRQGDLAEIHSHADLPDSSPVQKLGLTFLSALTPSLSRKPDTQDSRRVTGREVVGQKDLRLLCDARMGTGPLWDSLPGPQHNGGMSPEGHS